MLMHQRPPKDLPVSVLIIVVIVLISSSGVESQQSSTRSNGPSGSSGIVGDQTDEERIADILDNEDLPVMNESPAAGNCTQCSIREFRDVKRDYRIESIKAEIMRKLRLSNLPNVTGRSLPDIPHLHQIIESYPFQNNSSANANNSPRSVEVDDTYATTIRVIVFSHTVPPVYSGNPNIFTFNFTEALASQQVVNATMGIFLRGPTARTGLVNTWILVYRVRPLRSQERVLIHRKRIPLRDLSPAGQWFTFNMKNYVESSIQHLNATIGLIVQASDGRGEPLAIINPRNEAEEVLKPYLEIHVRDRGATRNKRMIDLDCDESSAESRCCRYPLVVDFEQFGWDWVIVPKRYSAYYCSGECPFFFQQRYTHTNLAQQASGTAVACCSPRKVSPMSMLYYDQNMNIVHDRLPGMVVDQCGCS